MSKVKFLIVKMTEKEHEETRELAKQLDLDMSKLVRMLLRKAKKQNLGMGELKPMPEDIV